MQNNEQRTWLQSVICQFHRLPGSTAYSMPSWFYLLLLGALMAAQSALCWTVSGMLFIIAAIPTLIQETRRAHGAALPFFGWWKLFQYFLQDAAAVVLIVFGAAQGCQNTEFAVGLIAAVVITGWAIFRYVLSKQ